jgi:hypothetical protein
MSRFEKLKDRFRQRPVDFAYAELRKLLAGFGYQEQAGGAGSRVAFVHSRTKHVIRLHNPHPDAILKRYQVDLLIEALEKQGYLP